MSHILITLNGEERRFPADATLTSVVADLMPEACDATQSGRARGVAAAINGTVVSRGDWDATTLRPDDRIEVVTAVQGG